MKTNIEAIKKRVKELIDESQDLKRQIDEIKEWSSLSLIIQNISSIVAFITNIAVAVESTVRDFADDTQGLKSEEKLDAAVAIIDEALKLPLWLELVDGPALKIAISIVVHFLNQRFGNDWDLMKT